MVHNSTSPLTSVLWYFTLWHFVCKPTYICILQRGSFTKQMKDIIIHDIQEDKEGVAILLKGGDFHTEHPAQYPPHTLVYLLLGHDQGVRLCSAQGARCESLRPLEVLRRFPCLPVCRVCMRCSHRQGTDNKQDKVSIQRTFLVLHFLDHGGSEGSRFIAGHFS